MVMNIRICKQQLQYLLNSQMFFRIIGLYPDGFFRPDKVVSRAEFAKIRVLLAGLTPEKATSTTFSDIKPTDWYARISLYLAFQMKHSKLKRL
jgi:hypothetical protein